MRTELPPDELAAPAQPTVENITKYENATSLGSLNTEIYEKGQIGAAEIAKLPETDRERIARFYGRFSAATYLSGHLLNKQAEDWKQRIIFESKSLYANPLLKPLIEKVYARAGYLIAQEKNTSSHGNAPRLQTEDLNRLAAELGGAGLKQEEGFLLNPFTIKADDHYFKIADDLKTLEDKTLGDIELDGADSFVDMDGDTVLLSDVNHNLASGKFMLRDGSNYFGELKLPDEISTFKAGQKLRMTIFLPTGNTDFEIEFSGTNIKELEEKYGKACMSPFNIGALIEVKYKYNDRELSWPLRNIKAIG